MTITQETKDELRRLQKAARDARARYDAALVGNAADEVRSKAVREAYEAELAFRKEIDCVGIGTLLDALAAAEAERDGLPVGPLAEIAAERRRQVDVEGWSTEHDDQHRNGEMAAAAACYAAPTPVFHAVQRAGTGYEPYSSYEPLWPWNDAWWKPTKPTTPRRDLIKAGALIVAELERLDRAALCGQSALQ